MYIRIGEIPREGLDVVASRGKTWIPKVIAGMNIHPLRELVVRDAGLVLTLEGRNLMASGSFSAAGKAECDRCAEPVDVRLDKEFDAVLVPRDRGWGRPGDLELHEGDLEIGFYDGGGIEVADVFWEQVALSLPVKVLCREDCPGLCPGCGAKRNSDACACPPDARGGPFEALRKQIGKKE